MQINFGFNKPVETPEATEMSFWNYGIVVKMFDPSRITDVSNLHDLRVDMVLYKDFATFLNTEKVARPHPTVKKQETIQLTLQEIAPFLNLIAQKLKAKPESFFTDANEVNIEIPESS